MKILILTSHLNIGGIPVYTVTLANYLQKRGDSVIVASSGGPLQDELLRAVRHINVPFGTKSILDPRLLFTALKLRKFVIAEKIDIIHAQTRVTQFTAYLVSKMTGVPYVVTWHGFYRPHFFRKRLRFWGVRTIAISRAVYGHLADVFKRDESKIRLVLNGVDINKFKDGYSSAEKESIKRRCGLKDGPIIGIISRIAFEKGHAYLVNAFKDLLSEIPDAQLVIVGEGKYKAQLKDKVASLGVDSAVHFFGETLETKELLAIMDVFTMPGLEEGFGLGIVEAMLMGLPVISTDVGDCRFILEGGNSGILVKPRDADGLKEALVAILNDTVAAKKMGEAARRYAAENFSAERMTSQIEDVYKEVLNERSSRYERR